MLKNSEIKRRELFKLKQRLITVLGELKEAQNKMLVALNDCFYSEYYNENSLKKGVKTVAMRNAIKRYANAYKDKLRIEDNIRDLENWGIVKE